jgi:hypothetical protein
MLGFEIQSLVRLNNMFFNFCLSYGHSTVFIKNDGNTLIQIVRIQDFLEDHNIV